VPGAGPLSLTRGADGGATLRIALPFATSADVNLARHGDDLVVTVGSHRRILALPSALRAHSVAGARLRDGTLRVRFRPDCDAGADTGDEVPT
jgi:arsenite-transporting ATPase